jgi:uncharacterized protein involved in type VI secretion and phage assembly
MIGDETQTGKRLRVVTAIGLKEKDAQGNALAGDPFLLTKVDGNEDVSKPFRFELEMYRDPKKPTIQPAQLVNTQVYFGVRVERSDPLPELASYLYRTGVFQSIDCNYLSKTFEQDFLVYHAVVVPAFQMLDKQIIYRVFERMDVKQILKEIFTDCPNLDVDFSGIESEDFPTIPYCVQFGESTFNFASRLMGQFGIWYFFNHNHALDFSGDGVPFSRMVLGKSTAPYSRRGPKNWYCRWPLKQDDKPSESNVAGWTQHAMPSVEWLRAGNFNPLLPVAPYTKGINVLPGLDLLAGGNGTTPPEDQAHYRSELFGVPVNSNTQAEGYAKTWMNGAETNIYSGSGVSKNPTLLAGFLTTILGKDQTGKQDVVWPVLITHVEIHAYEYGYGNNTLTDTGTYFKTLFDTFTDTDGWADFTTNAAAMGLNNWLQNRFPYDLQNWWHNDTQRSSNPNQMVPYFDTFVVGGAAAGITNLITLTKDIIRKINKSHDNDYGNSLQALYWGNPWPRHIPLPQGTKPTAQGPHLAVVIGSKGVHTLSDPDGSPLPKPLPEIHADIMGRVRVRFPWQRHVLPIDEVAGASGHSDDPLSSDRNTCWVRVTQGWAGLNTGWQFLPRVGEEVIVGFIGGDPDQPIVTGRVYHASATTNLPFPAPGSDMTVIDEDTLLTASGRSDFRFNGIKTSSTPLPKDDAPRRYHLLRFDDTYNDEQLLLRSQARMDITAKRSSYETTEGDRHVRVVQGKDANDKPFGGDMYTTTDAAYDLHVGDHRHELVEKDYQLRVKKDTQLDLKGNCAARVGGTLSFSAGTIVLQASQSITLRVGAHHLVVNGSGVWSDSDVKHGEGGPAVKAMGVTIDPVQDADKADPGEPADKRSDSSGGSNAQGDSGSSSGQQQPSPTSETVPPLDAPRFTRDSDNKISAGFGSLAMADGDGA